MLRVRFHKPCSAVRRLWQPGEEADFTDDLAHEIVSLGAAEIIGAVEVAAKTPRRKKADTAPLIDVPPACEDANL